MKKLLAGVFFLLCLISFSFSAYGSSDAFAQTTNDNPNYANVDANVPQNLHSLTQIATIEIFSTLSCQLAGIDPQTPDHKCLGVNNKTGKIGYVEQNGGLIGLTEQGIAFTFNIPAHTSTYVKYLSMNFGVASKAYAADTPYGVGFKALGPLLPVWAAIRNLIYFLFIIIFIVIGVGIMLRVQIDPRTVMSIENQLPKIAVALILISLSFAIAGFLIDMMWLVTFFVINFMQSLDKGPGITPFVNPATNGIYYFPVSYLNGLWQGGLGSLTTGITDTTHAFIINTFAPNAANGLKVAGNGITNTNCNWLTDSSFGCIMSNIFSWIMADLVSNIAYPLIWVITILALFIMLVRVWVALIKVYIYLILNILLSSVYFFAGLIPGSSFNATLWFKSVIANLTVYPAVVFLFLLARVLSDLFAGAKDSFFIPPLIGNPNAGANTIGSIMTLAILFICPNVPQFVDKIFGVEDMGIGAAVIRNFAAGPQAFMNITRGAANTFRDPISGKFTGFDITRIIPR